jgi:hypothetical protein
MNRLIQAATLGGQSEKEEKTLVRTVVSLLSRAFPDTWTRDIGHQIGSWAKSEKGLPHVLPLLDQHRKAELPLEEPEQFGELLLRCSW